MTRILFVDDMIERHERFDRWFRRLGGGNVCVKAWNVEEAVHALEHNGPFDVAYLDHDMGDVAYARFHDPSIPKDLNEKDGTDLVEYMIGMPREKMPAKVVCHSLNSGARKEMAQALRDIGVDAVEVPFTVLFR